MNDLSSNTDLARGNEVEVDILVSGTRLFRSDKATLQTLKKRAL
jgi:hypothetical protein